MNKWRYLISTMLFTHRRTVLLIFAVLSIWLGLMASQLGMDASFRKNIPLNHPYMQTYLEHEQSFGGANSVMVAVSTKQDSIFSEAFFQRLKQVHDQLFFIPGINRAQVQSLFSPSTRFTEVVEDGFAGGPVIPANFDGSMAALELVKVNIEKANIVGSLISNDYRSALLKAQLLEFDPKTGEKLDTLALAATLERSLRQAYQDDEISIHIIGFSKMAGDIADGAKSVLLFFAIAFVITALLVYHFCKRISLTLVPLACSVLAVVWQLGLLTLLGFGLDPMSILVPFLVFAIGVSHGLQMINAIVHQTINGEKQWQACRNAFVALMVPGGIALLSDAAGFLTLLAIDIGIIRELAISASLGVAVIILTNLILLPILLSFVPLSGVTPRNAGPDLSLLWLKLSVLASKQSAKYVLLIGGICFAIGLYFAKQMQIGDLHKGAPALHSDSVYNLDTKYISEHYTITTDVISVLVEASPQACTSFDVLSAMDKFQWQVSNTQGVISSVSLASVAKKVNSAFNEGNPKFSALPRTTATLVQAVSRVPTSSGLLNSDCSVMPIYFFLTDHNATTITRLIEAINQAKSHYDSADYRFELASGPVGVMAATNEAVSAAQQPMLLYIYGVVSLLCLLSFRSLGATLVVIIPLFVVSQMAQGLMSQLQIGLTVSTLPVIALGVGIGVDYGIYIISYMLTRIRTGETLMVAYHQSLIERGGAVLFTGLTLAIGVSTWALSALKFQVDMGVLLAFMFLVNMLGAMLVVPALATIFISPKPQKSQ